MSLVSRYGTLFFSSTILAISPALGANFTTSTVATSGQTLADGNTGTVTSSGSITTSGSTVGVTITPTTTTNSVITLTNDGTISQTGTGRAIRNNTSNKTSQIIINNNGTISSVGDDAIKIADTTATITINNQGTIIKQGSTPDSGQALDFRNSNATTGNTIINGSASNTSALIESDGDDAIRPSNNMSILNYGTIISNGPVNTKCVGTCSGDPKAHDGIDVGGSTGVAIDNYGTISGPRHGITADTDISVTNRAGATIIGRNGSGVGSDGTGTVINYGTITGAYAGAGNAYNHSAYNGGTSTANNGDGDGVDIDGIGTIVNYGTIQGLGAGGVDSGGLPNNAEGIAAGGGSITNHSGATIYGAATGILIDDGSNGTAVASGRGTATAAAGIETITNSGTITGATKAAIGLVGNYDDIITNNASGTITGGANSVKVDELSSTTAAAAIQMGAGNDTLTNYGTITGQNGMAIDMGSGNDTVQLLGGTVNGTIDGGSGTDSITLGYANNFSLSQLINFENFTIQNGASLTGSGSVNAVTVNNGGTLYPSSTINTATALFNSGSTFKINANPDGTNSKVVASGAVTINGGNVSVVAGSGSWGTSTNYTILSATGGITGTFDSVSTNLAFLNPSLSYDANNVLLTLTRNSNTYSSYATNSSGAGAAQALGNADTSNTNMNTLVTAINSMSASQASSAITQLGGASLSGSRKSSLSSSSMFQSVMSLRMSSVSSGSGIGLASLRFADNGDWASTFKHLADAGVVGKDGWIEPQKELPYMVWARAIAGRTNNTGDSSVGIGSSATNIGGLQMGVDKKAGDTLYGISFGVVSTSLRYSGDSTDVDGKSYTLGIYGSRELGECKLQGSAQYTIAKNDSSRATPTGTAEANYDSKSSNIWMQGSYGYKLQKGLNIEPYIEGSYNYYSQAEYDESGAPGANLRVGEYSAKRYGVGAGAKIIKEFADKKGSFDFSLGAVKEWGDLNKPLNMSFSASPSAGNWDTQGVDTSNTLYKMATGVTYKVASSTEFFGNLEASKRLNENSIIGIAGFRIGF